MITYFIKSGSCLALLLVFYHLVLEREKMHYFNRFYLLGSILFSFLAPLYIIYTKASVQIIETVQIAANDAFVFNTTEVVDTPINYWNYFVLLSIFISSILLIRFIRNIISIYQKIKKNEIIKHEKATLILVDDAISPHTFWNFIFVNKNEYYSQKIEKELFTHELTHATQKHTFDVLLIEVLKIIFWFNPIFYLLKKTIQLNHEFLADTKVISNHKNISEYQYLLLNKTAWNNEYYLASNLNYLLTKKRLLMMTKQSSRTKILFKKLAVIPVIIGFIFLFAERVEAHEENSKNDFLKENTTTSSIPEDSIRSEKFIASVERGNGIVILKCNNCERWANLKIPLNTKYTITDWGFSNGKNLNQDKYAFTIKATKNNITLSGLKNIVWKSLQFSLRKDQKQYLNQNGMIAHNQKETEELNLINKDTIPKRRKSLVINHSKKTFTYKTKNGKEVTKKLSELTEEEKKMIPPPPPPISLKKKTLSSKLFKALKNSKKYAISVDGKAVSNTVLSNYKPSDFYTYLGSFIHKNTRSKRFPQEYQYQLSTNSYAKKLRKKLPPPPPKAKEPVLAPPPPKTGFHESNGKKLYFVQKGNIFTFYNKYGQIVTKKGKIINSEQTRSDKVLPNQNISKVYKDDKVITEFKKVNLLPPPPVSKNKKVYSIKKNGNISSSITNKTLNSDTKITGRKITAKNGSEKGWASVNNQTLYYIKKAGKIEYFYRWGKAVDKNGKKLNTDISRSENVKYYLNDKLISKEKLDKINPKNIKNISVKKDKNGNGSIYMISHKK